MLSHEVLFSLLKEIRVALMCMYRQTYYKYIKQCMCTYEIHVHICINTNMHTYACNHSNLCVGIRVCAVDILLDFVGSIENVT